MSREPGTWVDPAEDPFTDPLLCGRAPATRFPSGGRDPRVAYRMVHDELLLDGVSRMNLATFCTTWAEPEVTHLLARSFDKNLVDKDEVPADRGAGVTVCAHAGGPVERAGPGVGGRHLDDRLQRGGHARRPGGEVAVAEGP
jgi:hypothetical protein